MDLKWKLIVNGLLLLATLFTGFLRNKSGKPVALGLHKLLALTWIVYAAIVVYHSGRPFESKTAFIAVIAILGLSIAVLIWSGSTLTMPASNHAVWLALHCLASVFAIAAAVLMARLLILRTYP
jgi:uncharacterized membrane protein